MLGCGPDPEREPSARSALAASPRPAPHGLAMEFPDLGAHCSEPSCQRLGEGRSARGGGGAGAGPDGWDRGLQVGRGGWAPELAMPGGRGSKLGRGGGGAGGRGQRHRGQWKEGVQCAANRAGFSLPEWKPLARGKDSPVSFPLNLQSLPLSVDFLPLKCDACSGIFCADHVAYAQHHCGSAYQKVRGRS